jgi:hypothetical protein
VGTPGESYLDRYFLFRTKRVSIFLHRFWSSDPDELHCHPWNNASFLLAGCYVEEHHDGTLSLRSAGDFVARSAREMHRISIDPAHSGRVWSLFFHGKRFRKWGFLTQPPEWKMDESYDKKSPLKGRFFPRPPR